MPNPGSTDELESGPLHNPDCAPSLSCKHVQLDLLLACGKKPCIGSIHNLSDYEKASKQQYWGVVMKELRLCAEKLYIVGKLWIHHHLCVISISVGLSVVVLPVIAQQAPDSTGVVHVGASV